MEPLCNLCKARQTKYSCIKCNKPLCNVCAKAEGDNTECYNEEAKRVGKCLGCCPHPLSKVQKTIFSAFGTTPSTQKAPKSLSKTSLPFAGKINPKQHKATTKHIRTVTPGTVEKWKAELATYSVSEWLTYDIDKDGI